MFTQEDLKIARENAAKAGKATVEFGAEYRKAKAEGKSLGEINDKLTRAMADFKVAQEELAKVQGTIEAASQYEALQAPAAAKLAQRLGADIEKASVRKAHKEGFRAYMEGGREKLSQFAQTAATAGDITPQEAFALLGVQDDLGGFLVPEDFRAEVIKDMAGFAVFRSAGARVVPTSRSELVFPSIKVNTGSAPNPDMYTSNWAGTWRREGSQGTDGSAPGLQTQPKFGQERIPVHVWQPDAVVVTEEFLEDSAVPVESVLSELIAETSALDEDYAFINGDGVAKPLGLQNSGLTSVNSGSASALEYNGILDLYADLPAQYRQNAAFLMNSATFAAILKLESSGGFNLFPANQLPGTILGKQVFFSEFMPDVAANAYPIAFGAFRYYVIAERADLRIKRLVERFAPNVGILPTKRVGGQVVRTNAFRLQKVSS